MSNYQYHNLTRRRISHTLALHFSLHDQSSPGHWVAYPNIYNYPDHVFDRSRHQWHYHHWHLRNSMRWRLHRAPIMHHFNITILYLYSYSERPLLHQRHCIEPLMARRNKSFKEGHPCRGYQQSQVNTKF